MFREFLTEYGADVGFLVTTKVLKEVQDAIYKKYKVKPTHAKSPMFDVDWKTKFEMKLSNGWTVYIVLNNDKTIWEWDNV